MAYFNHAFKKNFVATHPTQQAAPGVMAGVTDGILVTTGVHVSELKNNAAPYQLGPGVVGLFDAKTNLSTNGAAIGSGCCPFYLAAASIRTNDKIGPFHGGYQEANKSKIINPKYIRKLYKVLYNYGSQAILEIGGTLGNGNIGAVLTFDAGTLVPGTGYVTATDVATTGGTGTGLTVDITANAGAVTAVAVNNPGVGYTIGDTITIDAGNDDATIDVLTVDDVNECAKEFMCGQTYYLRIDVKGTPSLRFAQHNLYRTLDASGGCCADPENPVAVDPSTIYLQWATQIEEDPILNQYVHALLVVDGQSYAYNAEIAVLYGLNPATRLFSMAPTTSTSAGIVLLGAYVETKFGTCTFRPSDYYHVEPIQLYASEVDYTGNPCTFESLCVVRRCEGIQGNGFGEQKIREVLLSESYLQNFFANGNDLRIRELTQGTDIFNVLNKDAMYSSFFILHSVPRYNNPTGTFDNDQYLLEVIGVDGTITQLESEFTAIRGGCIDCVPVDDYTAIEQCDYVIPTTD